jgi:hypothetical protein
MKLLLKFASVALCFASTQLLHADPVLITLSSTEHDFSFSLDSQPTPTGSGTDSRSDVFFFFNDVALTEDGVTRNEAVGFSRSPTGRRQFDIGNSFSIGADGTASGVDIFQVFEATEPGDLFSGAIANPVFTPGTTVTGIAASGILGDNQAATFRITSAAATVAQTPEPNTFVLFGSGLLGFVGVVRRRFLPS